MSRPPSETTLQNPPIDTPVPRARPDERRRYHALTPLGRRVLAAEVDRLERTLLTAGLLDLPAGNV
ncbi:MAG: hypothetical protein L0271_17445 [Gemmatimonadetes bacterium]|nr:hypothetical protein [Gemmatimonadota bacterium]